MKIAFIGQKGIPATFGGVEYHVEELAQRLVQRGHSVSVYVRSWYTPRDLDHLKGIRLTHTGTINTKHLDAFVHSLTSSIHAFLSDYDIVHYHALGPTFFCWLPRITGKKIVATLHGLDWERGKWGRCAKAFLKFTERTAIYVPHRTIVVSQFQKSYFESKYRREVVYIPNGVARPRLRSPQLIKEKHGLNGQDYLLFMGRLVPEKRVDWLIEVFRKFDVGNQMSDVRLVIAGGTSGTDQYVNTLKELAGGTRKIVFTGYVTGAEKEEFLSNALLFLLPSYLEGLPIALLEGMSYGLPCLASDIPPHQEVIQDGQNGFLFRHDQFSDLAERLRNVLAQPERMKTVSENAKAKVRKEYDWDEVVRETEKVYESVLMSGR